ncbi:hypothetical protein [Methylocella tundrae]|nr:hypothetical protein [Methylocella tundrae]
MTLHATLVLRRLNVMAAPAPDLAQGPCRRHFRASRCDAARNGRGRRGRSEAHENSCRGFPWARRRL